MSQSSNTPFNDLQKFLSGSHTSEQDVRLVLTNVTRSATLADDLEVAISSAKRSKGLLGRTSLPAGGGLWIAPCESVHMFGMRFSIDLIYVDRALRVKKVTDTIRPWRISACLTAHSVFELPAGIVRSTGTRPGDQLAISPIPSSSTQD